MELSSSFCLVGSYSICETSSRRRVLYESSCSKILGLYGNSAKRSVVLKAQSLARSYPRIYHQKKLPKNLRYPRRPKLPPDPCLLGLNTVSRKKSNSYTRDTDDEDDGMNSFVTDEEDELREEEDDDDHKEAGIHIHDYENGEIVWESDEIEAISSLFKGRIPQKPGKLNRQRPQPLPVPYKTKPIRLPTQRIFSRKSVSSSAIRRQPVSNQVYKNPTFLIGLARDIKGLPAQENNVSLVLNKWAPFLRKGSLSITIRELGHMGLPERALQVFCWIQKQPHLFPDDRVLASTVEVLARSNELKMLFKRGDDKFISLASRSVYEAMLKGFIKGGNLKLAWKLLSDAKDCNRLLDAGVYAKFILELGKNPDKEVFVLSLLEELARREDLNLTMQDSTAIMKICVRLRQFSTVEALFEWFKKSGRVPSIVMYTTLVHSRYTEEKYREALAAVWEMEASNCLFDLTAYRVVIKLFVASNDLPRAVRYFSKLKEAGFSPTFDVYKNIIQIYMATGRIAKCKEVWKEAEMAGFNLDIQTRLQLYELNK